IDYRWSGLVAMTLDLLPHMGELEDRVFFAAGYNGTGIAMSSFLGRQLATLARGERLQLGLIGRPLKTIPLQTFIPPAHRHRLVSTFGRDRPMTSLGIIGTGSLGTTLLRAAATHAPDIRLLAASRRASQLEKLRCQIPGLIGATLEQLAQRANLVVLC